MTGFRGPDEALEMGYLLGKLMIAFTDTDLRVSPVIDDEHNYLPMLHIKSVAVDEPPYAWTLRLVQE